MDIAKLWKSVSGLFEITAQSSYIKYIHQASDTLKEISAKKKNAMELLSDL